MDEAPTDEFSVQHINWFGLFLIVLGVGWLGGMLGWFAFSWKWAGPLALIALGMMMVLGKGRHRRHWSR